MAKKLNQHVMTQKFRDGLTDVYRAALSAIGVEPEAVKPHIIGTATVTVTDAELDAIRAHYGDDLVELTGHRNNGEIEILLPEGEEFLAANRPTMTDEERKAKASKGGGIDKDAAAERKARREALRRRLADMHGIDLDADE